MVSFQVPLEFMGVPGSPYTRKMLALLRYRRIPYRLVPGSRHRLDPDKGRYPQRPEPKVPLLPTFYGVDEEGNQVAVCDSTPLTREFEQLAAERSVIPDQAALGLINSILEDYGDEWLTKAMFHYRWSYQPDIEKAAQMLPRWNNITASEAKIAEKGQRIQDLQISRLRYVGSNSVTADTIEQSFHRFLDLLDKHLNSYHFLLGDRPASSDFAIYGQLTCMALFDPTPQQLILERAPRVYAWTEILEDLSGYELLDTDWIIGSTADTVLADSLKQLLQEIGRVYVPYLLANAEAIDKHNPEMETIIDGRKWQQQAFPYQYKCLNWLRAEHDKLENVQLELFETLIEGTGLSHLFR